MIGILFNCFRKVHHPRACGSWSRYHLISTRQQYSWWKPNGHQRRWKGTCVLCCWSWTSGDSSGVQARKESVSRWLSGPFGCLGPPRAPSKLHSTHRRGPSWACNLSHCHAAALTTRLIQSHSAHGGTGRALIQFAQQQKTPSTHSSLPAERCQLLDVTLTEKYEDNYGTIIYFYYIVNLFIDEFILFS